MAGGSVGTVHGNITITYDSRGIAHARDDLGRFVSMSSLLNNQLVNSTDRGSRGFSLFGKQIAKWALIVAASITAVQSLLSAIQLLILAAVQFGPALAGSLALIPGLVLSAAAAFGVLKLALAGVGDAFKAALEGDAAKFTEALEKLAPNARSAATAFRDLVTAAKPLQQAIQNAFFANLAPQILAIRTSLAAMAPEAVGVASAFNGIVREALGVASTPLTIAALRQVLIGVRAALDNIKSGIAPLIQGFITLGGQIGLFAGGATERLGSILASFGNFLASINLAQVLDNIKAVVVPAGEFFSNLGTIISGVFNALTADSGNALGAIGAIVAKIAEFVQSSAGTAALNALGLAMQQIAGAVGQALLALLQALAPAIVAIAPVVGQLATLLGGILSSAFQALGPPVTQLVSTLASALAPVLPQIAAAFQSLAPVIARIAQVLGGVLGPLLAGLAPIIGELVGVLAESLLAALNAVLPSLEAYVPVFAQLAQEMLPQLIPLVTALGRVFVALAPALGATLNLFVGILLPLMQAASPIILALVQVMTFFTNVIATVIGWISQLIAKFVTINGVIAVVQGIVTAVAGLFIWLFNLLIGNSIIPDLVNGMLSWFRIGASAALAIWNAFVGAVGAIWRSILSLAQSIWNAIVSAIRNSINNVLSVIQALAAVPGMVGNFFRQAASAAASAVGNLLGVVRAIPGQVAGALGNLGGLLYSAGRSIIQGLVDGIRSMAGAVRDAVSNVMSAARNLLPFSPAKEGPFSGKGWTLYSGRSIMRDLARGIVQGSQAVQDAMAGSLGGLASTVSVTGSTGASAGSAGASTTTVAAAPQLTVHQTVNALPGMSAEQVGDYTLRRLSFGVLTGTSSVVTAAGGV